MVAKIRQFDGSQKMPEENAPRKCLTPHQMALYIVIGRLQHEVHHVP
ncbi:hypothetical protein BH10BAC6_BH10BAC6_16430 [soil metagenome]